MSLVRAAEHAADAIRAVPGLAVHKGPPAVLVPPCVVLLPGDPWLATDGTVELSVRCIVRTTSGRGPSLINLASLVQDARAALAAAGYSPGEVRPGDDDPESGTLTVAFDIQYRETP